MSVFRSAIIGDDGTVDPGYLCIFWTMAVTVSVIPLIVMVGAAAVFKYAGAAEIIQSTGIAIGAVCTGAGVVIGAVGAFRMGDKPHAQAASTTTTSVRETTTAVAPSDPLKVAVVDMPTTRKRGRKKAGA